MTIQAKPLAVPSRDPVNFSSSPKYNLFKFLHL